MDFFEEQEGQLMDAIFQGNVSFSSDSTENDDTSYQPSSSCQDQSSPTRRETEFQDMYNGGLGTDNCDKALWMEWRFEEADVSPFLWDFRRSIIEKHPNLDSDVEKLAMNFIYFFRTRDTTSGIYQRLGTDIFNQIARRSILPGLVISEGEIVTMTRIATQFSQLSHSQASDFVLDEHMQERHLKRLYMKFVKTPELWMIDSLFPPQVSNEHGVIRAHWDPLLITYISTVPSSTSHWDAPFPPSEARKMTEDPVLQARRIDYHITTSLLGKSCHFFIKEAKKGSQAARAFQRDTENISLELKDSLDHLCRQKVNITKVSVFGLVVVGCARAVYEIALVSRGLYIMTAFAEVYVLRSNTDMHCLAGSIDTFQKVKARIDGYIQAIATGESEMEQDWSMPPDQIRP
ncbi:hypothetical protein KI688_007425 [Linnemannia hyalina]|uniref:Uncharacterized protein n=1 Tax=Linnemannia hyalina TaxID=64524 RepID=A0A9P8BN44_9FUNG|nr:hypothetical protein KI688_007425 [Linnemannia hyalina]